MEQQVKAALSAVRNFLRGRSGDAKVAATEDKATRAAVAAELLATMSGREAADATLADAEEASGSDTEIPRNEARGTEEGTRQETKQETHLQTTNEQERERARQLFLDHGYFDEAIDSLRASSSPSERAAAARTMGIVGNRLGNVHLIAALFDDALEVRDAATEALAHLGDPAAANAAMTSPPANGGPTAPLTNEEVNEVSPAEAVQHEPATAEAAASLATLDVKGVSADEEAKLSAEATVQRREEEELRQREDEVLRRRAEEGEKLAAVHAARVKAEEEAHRFAQEDARLRLEVNKLRLAAEELARTRADLQAEREAAAQRALLAETERGRQEAEATHEAEMARLRGEEEALRSAVAESALRRAEVETARQEANRETLRLAEEREQLAVAEAARRAEADRLRREAEERARGEQEQLLVQVGGMRRVAEEVAVRRAEVESAREKAIAEGERLAEAQARMKAADGARQQAEAERLRLEAELFQRAEEERRLLDEVRLRAQEEQQRIEDEDRYRAAEQEQRLAQLAALRQRIEVEAQQRDEKERQISSQIESFRIADMQARKRIEEAEGRRRTAEDSYRLTVEKTQRVEAEARKAELEEGRILARLEEVRRNVALGTQSTAEHEKRIKEETEQLRRLEEAHRHRIEEAARSRVEAEHHLQQERDRLQLEEDARLRASEQLNRLLDQQYPETTEDAGEWHDDPAENLRPSKRAAGAEPRTTFTAAPVFAEPLDSATSLASPGQENGSNFSSVETNNFHAQGSPNWDSPAAAPASALVPPALVSEQDEFSRISARFDDPSPDVRNAAARELRELDPQRMVELFNRTLEEASPERRRNIGGAIAASGLAAEVIEMLGGESREDTYSALCLLLTMAKSGEVEPLVQAIEDHENVYVRIAAVRLLTLNGQEEIANAAARRRLEGPI